MKNNKIVIASILALVGSSAIAQSSAKENFETSAKIENFCSIQANDVNFGVVSLPLTAQSANAQMRVLCTNNTPYKVDLHYGQYVSGEGGSTDGYTIKHHSSDLTSSAYFIFNSSMIGIGLLSCGYGDLFGKVGIHNFAYAYMTEEESTRLTRLYGYPTSGWYTDTKNLCTSDNTKEGTKPTGWVGAYDALGFQPLGGVGYSEFGSMSGAQKGDKLAYKVTLPNDSSKTWTKGLNSYNSTGIGTEQMITINAQIVPDKSSGTYVAQDVYIDNITAEVTY